LYRRDVGPLNAASKVYVPGGETHVLTFLLRGDSGDSDVKKGIKMHISYHGDQHPKWEVVILQCTIKLKPGYMIRRLFRPNGIEILTIDELANDDGSDVVATAGNLLRKDGRLSSSKGPSFMRLVYH
jgi:hypothetical protein